MEHDRFYRFVPENLDRESLLRFGDDVFWPLEGIVREAYPAPPFEKIREGEIAAYYLAHGFDYRSGHIIRARLRFAFELSAPDEPRNAAVVLAVSDPDAPRVNALDVRVAQLGVHAYALRDP